MKEIIEALERCYQFRQVKIYSPSCGTMGTLVRALGVEGGELNPRLAALSLATEIECK